MAQVTSILDEQLSLFPLGADVKKLREELEDLLTWKRSAGTQRGYAKDMRIFSAWCSEELRADSLPCSTDTLKLFIAALIGRGIKISTIERRIAAIAYAHKSRGLPNPVAPECREILSNARRKRREKQQGKKALEATDLVKICSKPG